MADLQVNNSPETQDTPGKEEITSATEVILGMLKTSKAYRMYLPNNPLLQRFTDEICSRTIEHIARYGEYRLEIEQFEIKYRGVRVYENRDPKESLAFRMFSDGIRSFSFQEGIEPQEICDTVDIFGRERQIDTDDDIVTLLWLKDLPHISYTLTDEFLTADLGGVGFSQATSQRESIRRTYEEPPLPVGPPPIHRELHILTPEESAALQAEIEAEEKRNAHQEVVTIVSSILAGENDPQLVSDFLGIMANLISNLIRSRQAAQSLRLIRFLQKIENEERVPRQKRDLVKKLAGSGITAETVLALQASLDGGTEVAPEDAVDFFRFFGPQHVAAMCELLGRVQQMKVRKALISVLIEVGKDNVAGLLPVLRDPRWFLVRNVLFILGHFPTMEALEPVLRVAGHQDLRVRKEALNYLQKLPETRARTGILRFLQDPNVHLRIRALNILGAAKFPPALKPVEAMAVAKDFPDRDPLERRAIFEALGELGGEVMLPRFREMLRKRLLLGKGRERESVELAVGALRKMRTPGAIRLLEEAEADRRGSDLGTLIAEALRELRQENRKPGAGMGGAP